MKAEKYLRRHSEAEALSPVLQQAPQRFDYVLVLPFYDETIADLQRFTHLCARNNTLLILVLNQPQRIALCENNDAVLQWLQPQSNEDTLHWCHSDGASVLLIDRVRKPIADAEGVGLARKIGADCAFALITQGIVQSPWIFSTDADAYLPADYFAAPRHHAGSCAVIYPFQHVSSGDAQVDTATALYELRLHHYVKGLRRAGSPYAFHTLGSTLAIAHMHYAAAHGFPKRAGGEDFYLLNKLAKLAPVKSLSHPLIQLRARASHRVPFGTGPAVQKIADSEDPLQQPIFYDGDSFDVLGSWLQFFAVCADRLSDNDAAENWRDWLKQHVDAQNAELLLQVIDSAEFESTLRKAQRQCRDAVALRRYLHTWFDGFRTLKLLHALRDVGFPMRNFRECFGATNVNENELLAHVVTLNRQFRNGIP